MHSFDRWRTSTPAEGCCLSMMGHHLIWWPYAGAREEPQGLQILDAAHLHLNACRGVLPVQDGDGLPLVWRPHGVVCEFLTWAIGCMHQKAAHLDACRGVLPVQDGDRLPLIRRLHRRLREVPELSQPDFSVCVRGRPQPQRRQDDKAPADVFHQNLHKCCTRKACWLHGRACECRSCRSLLSLSACAVTHSPRGAGLTKPLRIHPVRVCSTEDAARCATGALRSCCSCCERSRPRSRSHSLRSIRLTRPLHVMGGVSACDSGLTVHS